MLSQYISVHKWITAKPVKIDGPCRYSNSISSRKTTFISGIRERLQILNQRCSMAGHQFSHLPNRSRPSHPKAIFKVNWDNPCLWAWQVLNKSYAPLSVFAAQQADKKGKVQVPTLTINPTKTNSAIYRKLLNSSGAWLNRSLNQTPKSTYQKFGNHLFMPINGIAVLSIIL